jgi:hypothetical protein
VSTNYVEVKLRASQLKLGDRLVSDDGGTGELVTRVTTRGGQTTVSHPSGHTRLIGDPFLRVLRRAPRSEAGHDLSRPRDGGPVRAVNTPRTGAPEQTRRRGPLSKDNRQQWPGRPAAAPVFLAAESTSHR